MRPTVLLFDIDGTLITTGGAGRRAIEEAFVERYGRHDGLAFSFGGMTDRAIVRAGLAALGLKLEGVALQDEIDAVIQVYLRGLAAEAARATGFRIHPAMEEALDRAERRPSCAVGLGTGNVRAGAAIKLDRVGLFERFPFGGFGCDHVERPELIRTGARRGAERLGLSLADCRVVVIGDTPKDVAAAQAIGAESIAVATGAATRAELQAAQATLVCASLADPGVIEHILT